MTRDELSDETLVARFVDGDQAAFDALVDRYERRVFGICYRYFGNTADAEEAAQDAFVALYRRAHTFRGDAKLSTWLYRVARNACNDLARKQARRPQPAATDPEALGSATPADDVLERRELALVLQQALAALDEPYRSAVVAHTVQGVPYHEIAAAQGVAVGTVKSRVHRGHARLAALLGDADVPAREPSDPTTPPT